MSATARQHAHDLLDRIPAPQLAAVARLLEVMLDPVSESLAAAAVDDEPVSAAEERDAERSRRWLAAHRGMPLEAVTAEVERAPRRRRAAPARRLR